jgi:phenylalanyl-tRNA synthetase alpha chain
VQAARPTSTRRATPAELEERQGALPRQDRPRDRTAQGPGRLPPDEKKTRGAEINQAKQRIEAAADRRREALAEAELSRAAAGRGAGRELPGRQRGTGGLHPVSRTMERIEAIFGSAWVSTWPKAPRSRPTG